MLIKLGVDDNVLKILQLYKWGYHDIIQVSDANVITIGLYTIMSA
jgi:hypothetical protein